MRVLAAVFVGLFLVGCGEPREAQQTFKGVIDAIQVTDLLIFVPKDMYVENASSRRYRLRATDQSNVLILNSPEKAKINLGTTAWLRLKQTNGISESCRKSVMISISFAGRASFAKKNEMVCSPHTSLCKYFRTVGSGRQKALIVGVSDLKDCNGEVQEIKSKVDLLDWKQNVLPK